MQKLMPGGFYVTGPHDQYGALDIKEPFSIAADVYIDGSADIFIGIGCVLSKECMLYTHEHYHEPGMTHFEQYHLKGIKLYPKTIEDDVSIGARAIILAGCQHIGKGSVIGAGAVVTRDIPPGQVWAGSPAIKVRDR